MSSFEYRTHPLASVLGGPVLHALAAAPQLFSVLLPHTNTGCAAQ